MTRIVVNTDELRALASTHATVGAEYVPLFGHALAELASVPNHVVGILSSGGTYLRYAQQLAGLLSEAPGVGGQVAGTATELYGMALRYDAYERGDPLTLALGIVAGGLGRAATAAGHLSDTAIEGVAVQTTVITEAEARDRKLTTKQLVDVHGSLAGAGGRGQVELTTEELQSGKVRVTLTIDGRAGPDVSAKLAALGFAVGGQGSVGVVGATTLTWDVADSASANRLKAAIAIVFGAGILGGHDMALITGALLRIPAPSAIDNGQGLYASADVDAAAEVEANGAIVKHAGKDPGGVYQSIELRAELDGEVDLPMVPVEMAGRVEVSAEMVFRGGEPTELTIEFDGMLAGESEVLGNVELGGATAASGRLVIDLTDLSAPTIELVRSMLADPASSSANLASLLSAVGDNVSGDVYLLAGGRGEVDADVAVPGAAFDASYEHSELRVVRRIPVP